MAFCPSSREYRPNGGRGRQSANLPTDRDTGLSRVHFVVQASSLPAWRQQAGSPHHNGDPREQVPCAIALDPDSYCPTDLRAAINEHPRITLCILATVLLLLATMCFANRTSADRGRQPWLRFLREFTDKTAEKLTTSHANGSPSDPALAPKG